jgi:hypothetical protein
VMTCRVVTPAQSTAYASTAAVENWDASFSSQINYVKFENISFLEVEETDLVIEFMPGQRSWVCGIQIVKTL